MWTVARSQKCRLIDSMISKQSHGDGSSVKGISIMTVESNYTTLMNTLGRYTVYKE